MNKVINVFICVIIGIITLFLSLIILNNLSNEYLEKLKILSYILISFSVLLAIFQFRSNILQNQKNAEWNKKQITIQQLHNSRKILNNISQYLNFFLNTRRNEPYKIVELHSLLGVIVNWDKLNDEEKCELESVLKGYIQKEDDIHNAGSPKRNLRFIFFKDLTDYSDIENIINKIILTDKQLEEININLGRKRVQLSELYYHQKWKNIDGKELHRKIHNFLSEYEYIATGISNEVFSIKIINDLMGSGFIQAYKTFCVYIQHCREYHSYNSHSSKSTLYIQFENVVKEILKIRGTKMEANPC
ncbi:DUF4760 domain-containing protein [Caminibacter pacificus]